MKITKTEFYRKGGLRNPALYRVHKNGRWNYYIDTSRGR